MSAPRRELVLTIAVGAAAAALLVADYQKTPFDDLFDDVARRRTLPADLLRALARHESRFRSDAVSGPNTNKTRDYGLMQVNEATARALGRDVKRLLEPAYNVETAAELLVRLRRELGELWSLHTWIAAYNAGSPAIKRHGVFNAAYVASVSWHHTLYQLAGLVSGPRSG